jgi:hypothetical protein
LIIPLDESRRCLHIEDIEITRGIAVTRAEQIEMLACVLFGGRWQRRTAAALGVDHKQIQRWASGRYEPTSGHVQTMREHAEDKIALLKRALAQTGEL